MDNSSQSAVTSLHDKREYTLALNELEGASRVLAIPSFAWDMVVQQVLRVASLAPNELLLNESIAPAMGSPAEVLGHKTLRSLVEGSKKDNGLEQDWNDFRAKMTALIYRTKYSISENDYVEINAQFEDSFNILGRSPIDSAEFHGAKQRVLADRVEELTTTNSRLQSEFDRKTTLLNQDLARKSTEVEQARADAQRVASDAAQSIQNVHRETARIQEQAENQANERIENERRNNDLQTQLKLTELRESLQADITNAQLKAQAAEGELADLAARIRAGEYVAKAAVDELNDKLSQIRMSELAMRNELLAVNQNLTDERNISASLREDLARVTQAREQDQGHIEMLEGRLTSIVQDRTQTTEFVVLNERLNFSREANNTLSGKLETEQARSKKLESSLNDVRGAYKQLRIDGRQYCDALKGQITTLESKNTTILRDLIQVKIALAIAMTCGVGAAGALALKHLGFF